MGIDIFLGVQKMFRYLWSALCNTNNDTITYKVQFWILIPFFSDAKGILWIRKTNPHFSLNLNTKGTLETNLKHTQHQDPDTPPSTQQTQSVMTVLLTWTINSNKALLELKLNNLDRLCRRLTAAVFTLLKSKVVSRTEKSTWKGVICSLKIRRCFIWNSWPSKGV